MSDSFIATAQGLLDEFYGKRRITITREPHGVVCRFAGGAVVMVGEQTGKVGDWLDGLRAALDAELSRGPVSYIPTDLSWLEPLRDLVKLGGVAPEDAQALVKLLARPMVFYEVKR